MVDRFPGNAPGSRPARSVFVIDPYTDFQQTFDDYQQGLRVDNLSNGWLFVPAVNRYIPPLTFGWSILLVPATRDITIRSVSAPAGIFELATNNDGQVTIELTSYPVAEAQGTPYNNVNKNTSSSTLQSLGYDIYTSYAQFTTSAVANTVVTEDLPFSPGGVLNIRVKAAALMPVVLNAAGDTAQVWAWLTRPIVPTPPLNAEAFVIGGAMAGGMVVPHITFPEPGIQYRIINDTDIRITHRCNLVSRSYRFYLYFTLMD